ncbi:tetraacyldisaccharide 4'-kinase [Alteromonas sp. D210916BOD_24]|uniref:tetraacyldisaccharide 4'-kinase n=1 Tax=Alteromonas sp. D210916BOD_24 TaxID=3157618 RepID=UPI00399C83E8
MSLLNLNRAHEQWYRGHLAVWLLAPLALLFYVISALRRLCYKVGLKKAYQADFPVIVVGNISVGGNGKTPVVLALADYYVKRGVKVGILSRGYGGSSTHFPRRVSANDSASEVGDEPRLLAARSQSIVVIDPIRARGAAYLVEQCNCELIICDDGLQHYALVRDVELVVMDDRKVGSGFLLPMGPLREGMWRMNNVDAIIHNSNNIPTFENPVAPQFLMTLVPDEFVNVTTGEKASVDVIRNVPCSAIAGIGAPQRFFNQLKAMGIPLQSQHPLPDHHALSEGDIPKGRVLMTEKDAVKAAPLAHSDCWYLPVTAKISDDFYNLINAKLTSIDLARCETKRNKQHGL